jgi:hypothetical protein
MFAVLGLGCSTSEADAPPQAPSSVPFLDAPAWLAELQTSRPELASQHRGGIDDPAWQALVMRPQYRSELITTPTATYASIVAREYSSKERKADEAWAQEMRDAWAKQQWTATLRDGRSPNEVYVDMRVGPDTRMGEDGHVYKVFFELDDIPRSVSPDRYFGFGRALERAGFGGASKVALRPGQVRFQYNNVIVYAPSLAMAECAEAVGLSYFADQLLHVGRGVDVIAEKTDYHHFLLTGGFDRLAPDVQAFIRHRAPLPANPCPGS